VKYDVSIVSDESPIRLNWKPSLGGWVLSSLIALSILALACWRYPSLRAESPFLALAIPLITAGMFIGVSLAQKGLEDRQAAIPLKDQPGWQRFFTLLFYRKHSPRWADQLFFLGCSVIYVVGFLTLFGMPSDLIGLVAALIVNLIASFIPCMLWNFCVLILVAAVDFRSGATPELDDEKTWLLRQVRNMY
jgi:hypothetical protein